MIDLPDKMTPVGAQIAMAIMSGEIERATELLGSNSQERIARSHIAGGTPLHVAAGKGNLELVQRMVELGMEVNAPSSLDGEFPITRACSSGHSRIVEFLLNNGAALDVSRSARNPLFAAISGRHVEIVQILLDAGVDSTVRYNSSTMKDMDAVAFSMMHGQLDSAKLIAFYELGGDEAAIEDRLNRGKRIAEVNSGVR